MNDLRKVIYQTFYHVFNYLSIRWNWRWINDSKLFFGSALVIMSLGANKEGQSGERESVFSFPLETASDDREVEYFAGMNPTGECHVDTIKEREEEILCYMVIEDMPTFPGGNVQEYFKSRLNYPIETVRQGITGKVFVQFIIVENGEVDSVKVARAVHPLLDAEAVRVVSTMPRWKPGVQRGKPVRVRYTVPVNFSREMLDNLRQNAGIKENDLFCYVTEEMPVFPHKSLVAYISERLRYPEEAKKQRIEGKVFVTFVIDTVGRVTDVKVVRGVHPLLDAEAIRVVEALPRWKPARQRGKNVRIAYIVPIEFRTKK